MICNNIQGCIANEIETDKKFKCCNNKNICIESADDRSKVKCEENNKKYILENTMKNQVISYKMDGGVIVLDKNVPIGVNKCDYLFVVL